ncbi:MAG: PepSY domain-containing protein [Gammaproteobacteria bacterium]|nr:PepSY domain-containing protein [Gammaproteobacteria bacterium]MBQ0839210.1 PepSY domain-containing protein [Gammaproteobacteria bacterium]
MTPTVLYRWHRRIGLAVFVAIIAWALSGLSHPIMSRINPRPVVMHPPLSTSDIASLAPLSASLLDNGIAAFEKMQLLNIDGGSFYRVEHGDSKSYINARSGLKSPLNDDTYAQQLARHYLGDDVSEVVAVELITAFDEEYLFINRFLPVYKVTFQRPDNMRAYVEVSTGRLATLMDDRKAVVGWVFRQLHSWVFIQNPWLRTVLMSAVLFAGMALSVVGLLMAWRGRSKSGDVKGLGEQLSREDTPASTWHRRLGIGFGVLMLSFSFSGLFHLLNKPIVAPAAMPAPLQSFNAQNLTLDWPIVAHLSAGKYFRRASLAEVDGVPYLRLALATPQAIGKADKPAAAEHHSNEPVSKSSDIVYINAQSSQACANCEHQHALHLAAYYARSAGDDPMVGQVEKISHFSSDYGFINKRMPVHAVHIGDDSAASPVTLFVETATGALAGRANNASRAEGWSFSYLHKWHFFDGISKTLRDILLGVTTLAIALLCLLGVWVSLKPRR